MPKKPVKKDAYIMPVRTLKVGGDWDKANAILKKKYNSGVAEYVRERLREFLASEKPEHKDQGALDV